MKVTFNTVQQVSINKLMDLVNTASQDATSWCFQAQASECSYKEHSKDWTKALLALETWISCLPGQVEVTLTKNAIHGTICGRVQSTFTFGWNN